MGYPDAGSAGKKRNNENSRGPLNPFIPLYFRMGAIVVRVFAVHAPRGVSGSLAIQCAGTALRTFS
jgi:hypothetical protein